MVSADTCAKSLPRADRRVRKPSGRLALPARRHLEEFFLEILRVESAAQENAACFGESSPPGSKPPSRQGVSSRPQRSQDSRTAQPMQRCLLARYFRRTLLASSSDGALAL